MRVEISVSKNLGRSIFTNFGKSILMLWIGTVIPTAFDLHGSRIYVKLLSVIKNPGRHAQAMVGLPGLKSWDGQVDMVGCPTCKHRDGQDSMDCILWRGSKWWDCHVEIMGRPGLYGGMARVLHDMSVSFSFHKKTKFTWCSSFFSAHQSIFQMVCFLVFFSISVASFWLSFSCKASCTSGNTFHGKRTKSYGASPRNICNFSQFIKVESYLQLKTAGNSKHSQVRQKSLISFLLFLHLNYSWIQRKKPSFSSMFFKVENSSVPSGYSISVLVAWYKVDLIRIWALLLGTPLWDLMKLRLCGTWTILQASVYIPLGNTHVLWQTWVKWLEPLFLTDRHRQHIHACSIIFIGKFFDKL